METRVAKAEHVRRKNTLLLISVAQFIFHFPLLFAYLAHSTIKNANITWLIERHCDFLPDALQ